MQKLTLDNNFSTVADMKESLTSVLKFPFDNSGYIEPGHKGRQQWIVQDEDVQEMYKSYCKCQEILFWCIQPSTAHAASSVGSESRKRKNSENSRKVSQSPKAKRITCAQKVREVEDIIKQLREKHGQTYTTEQLSCWAHMYNMEKHTSLETPPKLPFFTGAKQRMQETKRHLHLWQQIILDVILSHRLWFLQVKR